MAKLSPLEAQESGNGDKGHSDPQPREPPLFAAKRTSGSFHTKIIILSIIKLFITNCC